MAGLLVCYEHVCGTVVCLSYLLVASCCRCCCCLLLLYRLLMPVIVITTATRNAEFKPEKVSYYQTHMYATAPVLP